jgi:hypothetical protein
MHGRLDALRNVLDGCREKIARAERHMHDLDVEWRRWLDTNPHRVVPEYRPQAPDYTQISVHLIYYMERPPVLLSVILGEIVHNLRSTLDHLAWAIVPPSVLDSLDARGQKRIRFPTTTAPEDFLSEEIVRCVGEDTQALLEGYQLYNGGNEPLAALQSLWTLDKHRTIPVSTILPDVGTLDSAITHNTAATLLQREITIKAGDTLKPRTEIASLVFCANGIEPQVEMNGDIGLQIAFQDETGGTTGVGIAQLIEYVQGVRDAFLPLLNGD